MHGFNLAFGNGVVDTIMGVCLFREWSEILETPLYSSCNG